jgi:hypothetical protein
MMPIIGQKCFIDLLLQSRCPAAGVNGFAASQGQKVTEERWVRFVRKGAQSAGRELC